VHGSSSSSREVDIQQEPFHLLDCAGNQWFYVRRHDQLCKLLVEFLRGCLADVAITKEVTLRNNLEEEIRADIIAVRGHITYTIDVAVSNPAARSFLRKGSATVVDAAAIERERTKTLRYSTIPGLMEGGGFKPFVIEATGRLGPAARAFIDEITGDNTLRRTYFLSAMSACIAKYNSLMFRATRSRLQRVVEGHN
jgi:hypothetical protein